MTKLDPSLHVPSVGGSCSSFASTPYQSLSRIKSNNRVSSSRATTDSEDAQASAGCFATVIGSVFAFLSVSLVSATTLVIKLNPLMNASLFIFGQGICMFFIQLSLTVLCKADRNAASSLKSNWIGVVIKVTVIFFLIPLLFRIIPEMPFGDISVILTCGPCLLVAVFAFILFDEKLTRFQVFLIFLSTIGVICIIRPAFIFGSSDSDQIYPNRLWATLICIALACLITAQVLAVRKMGFQMNVYLLNTLVGISLTCSGITYQNFYSSEKLYNTYFCQHSLYAAAILVGSSVLSSFISPLESLALQRTKAAVYTSIATSKVVLDYCLQLIFFPDEGIFWSTILGAVVVTITAFDLSLNLDVVAMKWFRMKRTEIIDEEVNKICEQQQPEENVETNC